MVFKNYYQAKQSLLIRLSSSCLLTSDTGSVVVGSNTTSGSVLNIDESSDVLHTLLGSSSRLLGNILALSLLGCLVLHLSGTGKRSVDLSTSTKSENKMKGSLLGDIVVAERTSVLELCYVFVFREISKRRLFREISKRRSFREKY